MTSIAPRLSRPRLAPLDPPDWDPAVHQILDPGRRPDEFGDPAQPVFNVFRTLANYPAQMKRMSPWGNHLLFKSSLEPRVREILILRTGWVCQAAYEWAHHEEIALTQAGVSPEDVEAVRRGRFDDPADQVLIDAVDELLRDRFIGQATWDGLAAKLATRQLMDLVFTVGHYASMCMALNTFGVQLEPEYQDGAGR
ncbi:MAG: carboxymuconolactone decarboxylase family protein [Phenylobacterium sp.]|uniref:carboxymuconolactone decarboxylase family protein n=1 Tax=Phenylobacterium sp. TaxID=1871053 RepID=UPI001A382B9A|nr:carboxymuconolactone decarboxylase family protein [Phenylobacterium sp.]MBL8771354.1 carboxymuconolactone decarboxylase family protein [Phenylobacterium sp.]